MIGGHIEKRSGEDEAEAGDEDGQDEVDLETRLEELCATEERELAARLARSVLNSTDDVRVEISSSTITVETDHFSGTHDWRTNARNEFIIDQRGEYQCTIEGIDLSFSTTTMNSTAYEMAREQLAAREDLDPPPANSDREPRDDAATDPADDGAASSVWRSILLWIRRRFE